MRLAGIVGPRTATRRDAGRSVAIRKVRCSESQGKDKMLLLAAADRRRPDAAPRTDRLGQLPVNGVGEAAKVQFLFTVSRLHTVPLGDRAMYEPALSTIAARPALQAGSLLERRHRAALIAAKGCRARRSARRASIVRLRKPTAPKPSFLAT